MSEQPNILHADGFTYNATPSDIVQTLLTLTTPCTAVDVGAGAGRNVELLLQNGCAVTAVECGRDSLSLLREMSHQYPLLTVMENTLQELSTDTHYDAVLCTMTLHFLHADEIDRAITTLQSLVNTGGFVCLSSYIDCVENETLPESYTYLFPLAKLRQQFGGWKIHFYTEDYPVPSARVMNSGVNGGKGYKSARIVAQKLAP